MNVIADVVEAIIGTCCYYNYKNPIESIRLVSFLLDLNEFAPALIHCYEKGFLSSNMQNHLRMDTDQIPFAELEKQVETLEEIQK